MVGADEFLDEENWRGTSYELAIRLGARTDQRADERLLAALRAVWAHPSLLGGYLDRRARPQDQRRITPAELELAGGYQTVYGHAILPNAKRMVCMTNVVREESEGGSDWLDVCLPTEALARVEPRLRYPLYEQSRAWRGPLDAWFVSVAEAVAEEAPFRVAVIGEEAAALWVSDESVVGPSEQRSESIITLGPDGIIWLPPTSW